MPGQKDDFWAGKKEEFLQKLEQASGGQISLYDAQDWIERHGLVSMDPYIMLDNFQNPNYMNPLRQFGQQRYGIPQ